MHILVISDIPNGVDPIVDALNHKDVSIVAKEVEFDNTALVSIVSDYLSRKNFDLIVILPKDPIGANMALNKHHSITAALCESEDDVYAASKNNANTIILRRSGSHMYNVLSTIVSNSAHPGAHMVHHEEKAKTPLSHVIGRHVEQIHRSISSPRKSQEPYERGEDEPQIKYTRKGLIGRLMDELGILDNEK